jgi:aminoglycoside phosphotransferase (APT) family kinase protein
MRSRTKRALSPAQLQAIAGRHFGGDSRLLAWRELEDGYFNAAYRLDIAGYPPIVLKVAPADDCPILAYERQIMRTEVEVMRLVGRRTAMPVPQIHAVDSSREILDGDYYIMDFCPGVPLHRLRPELTAEQQAKIDGEVGRLLRQMNDIEGERFGLYALPEMRFATWREAFAALIASVLADGTRMGVDLPLPAGELYRLLASHFDALNEVETPQLVHWDLWDGNIFVDPIDHQIVGLIDFERALWADPLMENNFRALVEPTPFSLGYGRPMLDTATRRRRRALYNAHLYLIMAIEPAFRQYDDDRLERWARRELDEELARLGDWPG